MNLTDRASSAADVTAKHHGIKNGVEHGPDAEPPQVASTAVFGSLNAETISQAIRGDVPARERLWLSSRPWIVALVVANKPKHADTEDLVQDVAARFVRSISTLAEPAAFAGWIRTVTINTVRSSGRQARTKSSGQPTGTNTQPGLLTAPGVFPDHRAAAAEDRRRLLDRVADLPEMYREPLLLKSARGMTSAQIGAILGLSQAAVDTRLARARRMLLEKPPTD